VTFVQRISIRILKRKSALAAAADVEAHGALAVPMHLRNAPTGLMKNLGYGKDYKYAHNYDGHVVDQQHLPEELAGRKYYTPSDAGYEKQITERLKYWDEAKKRTKG
jgi:putative ATPase